MTSVSTLKQNTDFHRAYGRGKSVSSPYLVTYAVKNRNQGCRYGITTSKKLGSAVERNRCRRIIRAAFSSVSPECMQGYDLVFVARFKTKQLKTDDVITVMRKQLQQLGIISKGMGNEE